MLEDGSYEISMVFLRVVTRRSTYILTTLVKAGEYGEFGEYGEYGEFGEFGEYIQNKY